MWSKNSTNKKTTVEYVHPTSYNAMGRRL